MYWATEYRNKSIVEIYRFREKWRQNDDDEEEKIPKHRTLWKITLNDGREWVQKWIRAKMSHKNARLRSKYLSVEYCSKFLFCYSSYYWCCFEFFISFCLLAAHILTVQWSIMLWHWAPSDNIQNYDCIWYGDQHYTKKKYNQNISYAHSASLTPNRWIHFCSVCRSIGSFFVAWSNLVNRFRQKLYKKKHIWRPRLNSRPA